MGFLEDTLTEHHRMAERDTKIKQLTAKVAKLRAALEQLIRDYEDETGEKAMAARAAIVHTPSRIKRKYTQSRIVTIPKDKLTVDDVG